jgi:hypothetical protein
MQRRITKTFLQQALHMTRRCKFFWARAGLPYPEH